VAHNTQNLLTYTW